jgi:hypothetical protein
MRQADRDEAWAAGHWSPREALTQSLVMSRGISYTGLAGNKVLCMFGVGRWSPLNLLGMPWLLTSDSLPKHAIGFLRHSKRYFNTMRQDFTVLQNYVDARNTDAVEWLSWLGFKIDPPQPMGPDQVPFHRFSWRAE